MLCVSVYLIHPVSIPLFLFFFLFFFFKIYQSFVFVENTGSVLRKEPVCMNELGRAFKIVYIFSRKIIIKKKNNQKQTTTTKKNVRKYRKLSFSKNM